MLTTAGKGEKHLRDPITLLIKKPRMAVKNGLLKGINKVWSTAIKICWASETTFSYYSYGFDVYVCLK